MPRPSKHDTLKSNLDKWAVWLIESEVWNDSLSLPSNSVLGRFIEMNHTRTERHDLTKVDRSKAGKLRGKSAEWCRMKQDFKVIPASPGDVGNSKSLDFQSQAINQAVNMLEQKQIEMVLYRHAKKSNDIELAILLGLKPKNVSKRFSKIYNKIMAKLITK